jgi:hypothetical protein
VAVSDVRGSGTKEDPWQLTTPSGSSEYLMYRDEAAAPPAIVCVVGKTVLGYQLRAIDDLHPSAAPTSRSPRPKAPWRRGAVRLTTLSAAGTG